MACRISTLKPACNYNTGGIQTLSVLDWDDFKGYGFAALYDACLVTDIERVAEFVDVQADTAKYASSMAGRVTTHSVTSFVSEMSAAMISALHLASKRRYVVLFFDGTKYFTFGHEAGATLAYALQTDGARGAAIVFNCLSLYPLFEVTADAVAGLNMAYTFLPDFVTGAYCEVTA